MDLGFDMRTKIWSFFIVLFHLNMFLLQFIEDLAIIEVSFWRCMGSFYTIFSLLSSTVTNFIIHPLSVLDISIHQINASCLCSFKYRVNPDYSRHHLLSHVWTLKRCHFILLILLEVYFNSWIDVFIQCFISRDVFNKWQAQRWWAENYDKVMELYNVQRFNRQAVALPTPPRSEDEVSFQSYIDCTVCYQSCVFHVFLLRC